MIAQNAISTNQIVITTADFDRLRGLSVRRVTLDAGAASDGAAGRVEEINADAFPTMRCLRA